MFLAYILLEESSKILRLQTSSAREMKDRIYIIRKIRGNCRNYFYEKSSEKEGCAIKKQLLNVGHAT